MLYTLTTQPIVYNFTQLNTEGLKVLKRTIFLSSLLISTSFSLGLDEIVKDALVENFEVQKLLKDIDIAQQSIELSTTWANPMVTFGVNDVHFDEPLRRDKEAMQTQYISLSQIVPINNKLGKKKVIFKEAKVISKFSLEDKKLYLSSKIKELGYSIIITNKKIELLKRYQVNTKELENIAYMLYESGQTKQTVPLNAKLLNSKLQIQMQNLEYKLKSLKIKLKELTYKDISSIEADLDKKSDFIADIELHPAIQALKTEVKKQLAVAKFKKAQEIPDVKVNLGYFQREGREDYLSASVNFALPVRGIESKEETIARYKALRSEDKLQTLKITFQSNLDLLKEKMQTSYSNYETLLHDMKGQKEYIGQNLALHAQLGHMNSIDLIQNINDTISLEMMAFDELNNYFVSYAKSLYFKGEL